MIEQKIARVPTETWVKVCEIVNRTRNHISIPEQDLDLLFEVYNKYFTVDLQKKSCSGCVMTVVSQLRRAVPNE